MEWAQSLLPAGDGASTAGGDASTVGSGGRDAAPAAGQSRRRFVASVSESGTGDLSYSESESSTRR